MTRREFCRSTGALTLYLSIPAIPAIGSSAEMLPLSPSLARNPVLSSWIRLHADGSVALHAGKVELGQGIGTALAQIVADELDVALERIQVRSVDTDSSPDESYSFSSVSIQHSGSAVRQAAAQMRHILVSNAATVIGADARRLTVDDGHLLLDGSATDIAYTDLISSAEFDVDVTASVRPKSASDYRHVGQSPTRVDLSDKIFAAPAFIQDIRLPEMVHARVLRPPHQGQPLEKVDTDAVANMPGLLTVVRNRNFLAVVAEREEQAIAISEKLRSVSRWGRAEDRTPESELPAALRQLNSNDTVVHESAATADNSSRVISSDYSRPFTAHASISPAMGLALWDGDRLTIWSHGQGMFPLRGALAEVFDLPVEKLRLIYAEASGCYGHNGADDAACDAALVALTMPGRPVRLQWSRQDEFRYEPYGSAMSVRVSAGLDDNNRITHWHHDVWSATHSTRSYGPAGAGNLLAAREKENPVALPPARNIPQPAGGGDRNALPLYNFANQKISKHLILESPLGVSALRSLGAFANIFAIESFLDELAEEIGEDPLALRLSYLDDPRAREVIKSLRDFVSAEPKRMPKHKSGRGLGFARFKNLGAYAAVACEVHVNEESGEVVVSDVLASVDAGLVISPDGLRNQIEGGIVQSISWTLKEAVHYNDERIESSDWASYPILRFSEVPHVEVTILNRTDQPSLGAGEAAQGPAAAAVGNAVARALGSRIRDLPMTPTKVQAAVSSAAQANAG